MDALDINFYDGRVVPPTFMEKYRAKRLAKKLTWWQKLIKFITGGN